MKRLFFLNFFLISFFSFSQCLDETNKKGYFDTNTLEAGDWWKSNVGVFSIEKNNYYYGTGALKVEVPLDNTNDVKMFTTNDCSFSISNDQHWNVSMYIKGDIGDKIVFSFIDADNSNKDIGNITQEVNYKGWHYIRVNIKSNAATSNGKFKINFISKGTYWIDNVVLEEGSFNTWFVDDDGIDSNEGSINKPFKTLNKAMSNDNWKPGDIINIRDGVYTNSGYGSGERNPALINISESKNGTINRPIVIRNYPGETPKINFDGKGGILAGERSKPITHLEIAGLEIQGPNSKINFQQAKANRDWYVNNNSEEIKHFFHGRGIAIWGGSYINIHGNKVYDTPNSGIRVNNSDYCRVSFNEVYNTTFWSFNAESAIVFAQSKSIDEDQEKIKMRIENNLVYNNMNKLPFYNKSFPCTNSSYGYGCKDQPYIHDGSGCYITRNNNNGDGNEESDENPNGQYKGVFYFSNNISYGNGINGLVVHKTDYAIVTNNAVYENGAVPTPSEIESIKNGKEAPDWQKALNKGRQETSGITVHSSSYVKLYNNISWVKFDTDFGLKVFNQDESKNLSRRRNILWCSEENVFLDENNDGKDDHPTRGKSTFGSENTWNNTIAFYNIDPKFISTSTYNFKLKNDSPAINKGEVHSDIPFFDFDYLKRNDSKIDIGPYEYIVLQDLDGDGIEDTLDNCPSTANTDQADMDGDDIGDLCDDDKDGDGKLNSEDNCPDVANADQADMDGDGIGDVCDDDKDGDTILNDADNCPTTANTDQADADKDGIGDVCDSVFNIPFNNNKVEVTSATCIGTSDGSIGLSVEDNSFDYSITVTGKDDPIAITGENKTASVTGLSKGTYSVCFKVTGQAEYQQCFEVVIGEPKALSAFIDVDNDNRTTSIQLTGSKDYNIDVNGERFKVTGDNFTTSLPTGLSIIKISTDLDCQGVIEREVFISEDIHFYPNPTKDDVNVHVGGEDTEINVSVFSEKGDLIYRREQQVKDMSRLTEIDLSLQITGTYIVVLESKTVRKTFKIVRN